MELSKPWSKFFASLKEIETLSPAYWKEKHFLAYSIKRYEDLYSQKFCWSFKGPPSKCTELILIKKMCAMLNTSNPLKIKSYIDWIFDKKIIPKHMKIRTLGFLTTPGLGNEFNYYWDENHKITKTTPLPISAITIAQQLNVSAETYGDLAFICAALEQDKTGRENYQIFIEKLQSIGLDFSPLKGIQ